MHYRLREQQLVLLPEKAIYWQNRQALLVADTHFGKITHFRKAGIAVPHQAALNNLQRFEKLLKDYSPREVIFLGDLFHSEMNSEWLHLKNMLQRHPEVTFHLVQGNHDILPELSYRQFQLHPDSWECGPFLFSHDPLENYNGSLYNLSGHLHPGVRMSGNGRQSLRFPCFYFAGKQGILPAFGEFTGLHLLRPGRSDEVFVVTPDAVIRAA